MQGDSWTLAVAAPIKNHKFEFGQNRLASCQSNVAINALNIPIPVGSDAQFRDRVQYNDTILLGPSTDTDDEGETELIQLSGTSDSSPTAFLYSQNKDNSFKYNTGDSVTLYGTGMAGGWSIPSTQKSWFEAQGIKRGLVSINTPYTYTQGSNNDSTPTQGTYSYFSNSGNSYIVVGISNSVYGGVIDIHKSVFEYIIEPKDSNNYAWVAVSGDPSGDISAQHGDWHRGGWRKDSAQRIEVDLTDGMASGRFFSTDIIRTGSGSMRQRGQVIPWQYYRIGGRVYIDTEELGYTFGNNFSLFLILNANTEGRDVNFSESITVTFASSTSDIDKWLDFSTVGILKAGLSNTTAPKLSFWFQNNGISGAGAGDKFKFYIDDVYAEHAGGVNYAATDGSLDFGRYQVYPITDSLKIDYTVRAGSKSLYGKKDKLMIKTNLEFMSQDFWDQLDILLNWQYKGYSLNLHVNINDLPYSIIGKMTLKNIVKDTWDLSRRSCQFEFLEDD